mmetsp:Transcript_23244/g.74417  ORF Transcript_23244/g.74417 Transcript_23244/m.74417 type:complete len:203 (-) Transcript_23244:149-757(-)
MHLGCHLGRYEARCDGGDADAVRPEGLSEGAGQRVEARLARAISGCDGFAAVGAARGDKDDSAAAPVLASGASEGKGELGGRCEVGAKHALKRRRPVRRRCCLDWMFLIDTVVDYHAVQRLAVVARGRHRVRHELPRRTRLVECRLDDRVASPRKRLTNRLCLTLITSKVNQDAVAIGRESSAARGADSAGAAGDEDGAAPR